MSGSTFQILKLNLRDGAAETVIVDEGDQRDYIGGASLAARLLYPTLTSPLDPLSPEAPLLIMSGPLTGTVGPAVGRFVICARSPATQLWGESNVGGHFGPMLRAAGFDGLIVSGRADEPVYLWIHEGEVEIRPAGHLWGVCDTYATQGKVKQELGKPGARVACIGLAGENELPFALVLCDHGRVAGRTGMGAVMGSKKLKAIAVHGGRPIPLADSDAYARSRRRVNLVLRQDSVTQALRELGTSSGSDYFDYLGFMPKRYFTRRHFERTERISGSALAETILSGVSTCHGCVIACGRRVKLGDGAERKGPEFETIVGFGPNLLIDDLTVITRLGELCDRYGMDTISLSNVIGLAMALSEEGLLSTPGLTLRWGDAEVVERLIHQTARREGLGARLAQGARMLAEGCGVPEVAAQVNGLEVAYHDPRGASGMALVYATSPRGACHNQSDYYMVEIGQTMEEIGVRLYSPHDGAKKAANVARHQDWQTVRNSLVLCQLANVAPSTTLELLNLATGFEYSLEELLHLGERAWNLKRAINHRLGLAEGSDRLPGQLRRPFLDLGEESGEIPFEAMLAAYYAARRWDPATGKPTPERLRELGLEEIIPDLWSEPA